MSEDRGDKRRDYHRLKPGDLILARVVSDTPRLYMFIERNHKMSSDYCTTAKDVATGNVEEVWFHEIRGINGVTYYD